ncbi:MAG TPA: hypothetical protein VFA48_01445 [Gammaproteobacteria bacterium]|nr:hypothetical protein [Gammaproteobacteria bacterium]
MTDDIKHVPDVGAQDPERRNSPIVEDDSEELEALREESDAEAVCYFNEQTFWHGTYVRSGTVVLRCDRGLWIPLGSSDPDNP